MALLKERLLAIINLGSPPDRADPTGYPDPTTRWVGWVVENRYPTQPILTQLVRILNPLLNKVKINIKKKKKTILSLNQKQMGLGRGLAKNPPPNPPPPNRAPNPPNPTQPNN